MFTYCWFAWFSLRRAVLPPMLKVGRKGYIILPKALRETYVIKEGDYVVVEAC